MALTLTSEDIGRLQATQEVLLSPLEHDSARGWCTAVVDAVGTLFRSDRALFNLTHQGRVTSVWGEGLAPFSEVLTEIVSGAQPGAIRYRDDHLDRVLDVRRQQRLEVWSNRMLERLHGTPMEEMPFYREFMEPAQTAEGGAMTISLHSGEAMIASNPGPPGANPFGEDWLDLFRTILPAFKAGTHALLQLDARRENLVATLGGLGHAVGVWSIDGREIHRDRDLRRLLASDAEAERILSASRELSLQIALFRMPRRKSEGAAPTAAGQTEVTTRRALYRLSGAFVPAGLFGRDPAVLICVDPATPVVPPASTLRSRFGLTRREAQVAQLLALGLSNDEVGERLHISPHTVRSHGERIFRKLDVHTRGQLAHRVLTGLPTT